MIRTCFVPIQNFFLHITQYEVIKLSFGVTSSDFPSSCHTHAAAHYADCYRSLPLKEFLFVVLLRVVFTGRHVFVPFSLDVTARAKILKG